MAFLLGQGAQAQSDLSLSGPTLLLGGGPSQRGQFSPDFGEGFVLFPSRAPGVTTALVIVSILNLRQSL